MKKISWIAVISTLIVFFLSGCTPQPAHNPGPGGPGPQDGQPFNPNTGGGQPGGQTPIANPGGPQQGGPQQGGGQPGGPDDPQPTDQPKGPPNPQPPTPRGKPGGGEGPAVGDPGGGYVDLALSDIYLDGAEVLFSIRNVGTAAWPTQSVIVTCRGEYADNVGRKTLLPTEVEILPGTLDELGSAADISTGYSLDPGMTSLSVECSINPNPWDSNPVNDRIGPVKIK